MKSLRLRENTDQKKANIFYAYNVREIKIAMTLFPILILFVLMVLA